MTYSSNHANFNRLAACAVYSLSVAKAAARVASVGMFLVSPVVIAEKHIELADLSLEELANVKVTSVSKKAQPLSDASASIYVITASEIRRSGATTIPEVLRLAPNLQVARINAQSYAISARGFNSRFSNKLLVLIDGRAVYSPLFSGTFWAVQDLLLDDIERIEVISGPGTTLWGANAVNGVINITTRSAAATQGTVVSTGVGNLEAQVTARHGGELSGGGSYRVYAKHTEHEGFWDEQSGAAAYGLERVQAGFRADWSGAESHFTVQGDAYTGDLESAGSEPSISVDGVNFIGRYSQELNKDSHFLLQAYVDHTQRDHAGFFVEHLNTLDLEVRHSTAFSQRHNLIWGGGYRYVSDSVRNQIYVSIPEDRTIQWGNVFVQDDIALYDKLKLTLGAKVEKSSYTGAEFLPSVSLSWDLSDNHLLWGKWSRSVRSPSRAERDLHVPAQAPSPDGRRQYILSGNPTFRSEVAKVYELGYRAHLPLGVSLSFTGFQSQYEKLRSLEPNPNGYGYIFENRAEARVHGVEAWGNWQARERLRLSAGFVLQDLEKKLEPGRQDLSIGTVVARQDPDFYWTFKTSYQLSDSLELFAFLRHVSDLPDTSVRAYTDLNLRLGWQVSPNFDLSLVGQNLLNGSHAEYSELNTSGENPEAVYLKAVWGL